jgi:Ca-activated chloride channel family protein
MSHYSFEYPWVGLLIVLFVICHYLCHEKSQSLYFPHLDKLLLKEHYQNPLLWLLKWLGIVMAIIALASPVVSKNYNSSQKEGRDIVLIIDTSESMKQARFDAKDESKNKFTVVQEVASDFVARRVDDRIGLISFADVAFVASPLTFQKDFLQQIIILQRLGVAGKRTAINDALVQGYNMLSHSQAQSKVIILLTDGMDNMSRVPFPTLKTLIAQMPVKLYTIGIGSSRDYDGAYLKELAKAGGGIAFDANSAKRLSQIYQEIDRLEASKIEARGYEVRTYLFVYPLFVSILSLLFFLYLKNRKGAIS